jgi:DNA-binding FrmR family transcriptional regulator
MKKNKEQLLNNVIGQLEGIKRMMENEKDCFEIIIQMKAVRSAVETIMKNFMEENFTKCVVGINKKDREKLEKLLKEILKNN